VHPCVINDEMYLTTVNQYGLTTFSYITVPPKFDVQVTLNRDKFLQ